MSLADAEYLQPLWWGGHISTPPPPKKSSLWNFSEVNDVGIREFSVLGEFLCHQLPDLFGEPANSVYHSQAHQKCRPTASILFFWVLTECVCVTPTPLSYKGHEGSVLWECTSHSPNKRKKRKNYLKMSFVVYTIVFFQRMSIWCWN